MADMAEKGVIRRLAALEAREDLAGRGRGFSIRAAKVATAAKGGTEDLEAVEAGGRLLGSPMSVLLLSSRARSSSLPKLQEQADQVAT
jgi:hypothetical protein